MHQTECNELAKALSKFQGEVENAKKVSNNPHFKSKYADLATIWDAIREPLAANGLSIVQVPVKGDPGFLTLRSTLLHSSGQSITSEFSVKLSKDDAQGLGSATTYARRYSLMGLVGIASEDDDGNAAVGRPGPSNHQAATAPKVDYTATKKATMEELATLSDTDAKKLYAEVRNSAMGQPDKDELLLAMAASIKLRGKTK